MSRWGRFEWRVRLLAVIDGLLGTHLLDRTVNRWQEEVEAMQTEIASLQTRLEELDDSRGAILRHLCLSYLQLRQARSPDGWLHFDPRNPAEESAIDILTRALVVPHWARWTVNQVGTRDANIYTYDLVPNWAALRQEVLEHTTNFSTSLLDWVSEQME